MSNNETVYQAVATIRDPRTVNDPNPHEERGNLSRGRAIQAAKKWAAAGYWGSVYNQRTGECVEEYLPDD